MANSLDTYDRKQLLGKRLSTDNLLVIMSGKAKLMLT